MSWTWNAIKILLCLTQMTFLQYTPWKKCKNSSSLLKIGQKCHKRKGSSSNHWFSEVNWLLVSGRVIKHVIKIAWPFLLEPGFWMVLTKRFGPTEIDVLDFCLQCVQGRRRNMALQITTGTGSWFAKMLEGNGKRYNHLSTKKQGLWSLLSLFKKLGDDLISHMNRESTKISHDPSNTGWVSCKIFGVPVNDFMKSTKSSGKCKRQED